MYFLLEGRFKFLKSSMEESSAVLPGESVDTLLSHVADGLVAVEHTLDERGGHVLGFGLEEVAVFVL